MIKNKNQINKRKVNKMPKNEKNKLQYIEIEKPNWDLWGTLTFVTAILSFFFIKLTIHYGSLSFCPTNKGWEFFLILMSIIFIVAFISSIVFLINKNDPIKERYYVEEEEF